MRRLAALSIGLIFLSACGSGGGSGGGGNGNNGGGNHEPPPGPTTLYVRASGDDSNDGSSADRALRSISVAADKARAGATIIVGPGTYSDRVVDPRTGAEGSPITYVADSSGTLTNDDPGIVLVDATDAPDPDRSGAAFRFSAVQFIVIDGFTITGVSGGSSAGIFIRNKTTRDGVPVPSHDITVRNCHIEGNQGDGIRISNSNDIQVFNNLIVNNGRRGVAVVGDQTGSQRLQLINNTIVGNQDRGVFIGENGASSSDAFVHNNIIQDNGGPDERANIQVHVDSLDGFDSAANLVFPPRYNPSTIPSDSDINEDAVFINAGDGDYHLDQSVSPAIDVGDSGIDGTLLDILHGGSTDPGGQTDVGDVDLGFHYSTDQPITPPGPAMTFYVRVAAGSDANDGLTPAKALRSIGFALSRAHQGDTVIVGPGLYTEGNLAPRASTTLLADASGAATGDNPGAVRIDARSRDDGVLIDRSSGTVVDGFEISRAHVANIHVRNGSDSVIVRNCQIHNSFQDGIAVEDSSNTLVFNNLVSADGRHGINVGGRVDGSSGTRIVNNTVVDNDDRGIRIGDTAAASPGTLVENNIVQGNMTNIQVFEGSVEGYEARYNLVFEGTYFPDELPHPTDINEDASFVDPAHADYHLAQSSPAIDAADPATDGALATRLRERTTASNGAHDAGDLDLGYHYP